jgi:GxxExxY protein
MLVDVIPLELTHAILGSAIRVHAELGPGLLESTYQICLVDQLRADGMTAVVEKNIPVQYRGRRLDAVYRADIIVNDSVLLELKAVDNITPVHRAQTVTYLRHSGLRVALLINFNAPRLMSGVRRFVR